MMSFEKSRDHKMDTMYMTLVRPCETSDTSHSIRKNKKHLVHILILIQINAQMQGGTLVKILAEYSS